MQEGHDTSNGDFQLTLIGTSSPNICYPPGGMRKWELWIHIGNVSLCIEDCDLVDSLYYHIAHSHTHLRVVL